MTQLSDEILIAYADGELGPSQIGVVDAVLASDGVTNEQFQQVQSTNKRLSQAFATMLQAQARQGEVNRTPGEAKAVPQVQKVAGKKQVEPRTDPCDRGEYRADWRWRIGGISGWK